MNYPIWYFHVAIAANLTLVLLNLYLLWKIPRWHRRLRNLRLRLTTEERNITADLTQARQQWAIVPAVKDKLITRKQQFTRDRQRLGLLIKIYTVLTN